MMTLYEAYCAGWRACLTGVDGRYWFMRPEDVESDTRLRHVWQMGWQDAFDCEEDDGNEPLPESWLSLEDFV